MRICRQCQCEMIEGFDVRIENAGYGIKIAKDTGIFAKRIEKPKVAICPKCSEISLYVENINEFSENK